MAPPPLLKWKVTARKELTHDVFELKLGWPDTGPIPFRAGQYMSIVIPGAGPGGRNLRRAYSIASPPEWDTVELCVKLVEGGPGTSYLNTLQAGSELQGQMPFGDFVLDHDLGAYPTLFIGTGTGLAPMRAMILSSEWKPSGPYGFLLGVREEKDIIYPELFQELVTSAGGGVDVLKTEHARIALSRPTEKWTGFRGRVTDYLREMIKSGTWDFSQTHYYLCGSGAMLAEVKEILLTTQGVQKEQIHTEKYY